MSSEWRRLFIRGKCNEHKDHTYRNILIFQDQSLCPLNGGVPKEKFHCITFLSFIYSLLETLTKIQSFRAEDLDCSYCQNHIHVTVSKVPLKNDPTHLNF